MLALPLLPIAEDTLSLRGLFKPADPRGYEMLRGGIHQLRLDWWVYLFDSNDLFYGAGGLLVIVPLAAFGAFAALRGSASGSKRAGIVEQVIVAEIVGCAAASYVASSLVTRFALLQPYRMLIPLAFFACVPAGRGIAHLMRFAGERRVAAWALVAIGIVIVGNAVRGRIPLLVLGYGNDAAEQELVSRFERETRPDERILVESTHQQLPVEGRLSRVIVVRRFVLLPLLVEREFLGYIGNAPFLAHRYASFEGGRLFGKRLSRLTETEFSTILSRYDVSWVVACTGDAVAGVSKFAGALEEVKPAADCRVFRVRSPARSRFLEGSGEVRAMLDRLEVTHAAGDRLVLKYHWMPSLRTDPPLPIEEARQPGAAVGFIAIRPGATADFTIRVGTVLERLGLLVAGRSTNHDRGAPAG